MPATVFSYDENYLMVIDVYILEVCPSSAAGARSQRRSRQTGETRSRSQNRGVYWFTGIPWSGSTGHKSGGAEGHAEPPVGQIIQYSRARVAYPYSMECMLYFMFAVNILTLFSVITSPHM